MKTFHYGKVQSQEANEGASKLRVRWLITKEMGAPNFAMRLFEMEPGGFSPLHSHDWEHEVFVLEGEGTVVSDKGETTLKSWRRCLCSAKRVTPIQKQRKTNIQIPMPSATQEKVSTSA